MNILYKRLFFFIILISLMGCQNVREGLSLKKKQGVDEFLIEKKNPLVVPPEFSELPKPIEDGEEQKNENEDINLSKVLKKNNKENKTKSSNQIEKSISNILNKK